MLLALESGKQDVSLFHPPYQTTSRDSSTYHVYIPRFGLLFFEASFSEDLDLVPGLRVGTIFLATSSSLDKQAGQLLP